MKAYSNTTSNKILVCWKKKNEYEIYSTLELFVSLNPSYKAWTIRYYITRKKVPYETDEVLVIRVSYFDRTKSKN